MAAVETVLGRCLGGQFRTFRWLLASLWSPNLVHQAALWRAGQAEIASGSGQFGALVGWPHSNRQMQASRSTGQASGWASEWLRGPGVPAMQLPGIAGQAVVGAIEATRWASRPGGQAAKSKACVHHAVSARA